VHFTISQLAVSGIKVNRLDMYGEVLFYCIFCNIMHLAVQNMQIPCIHSFIFNNGVKS